jgi:hypothetical protein
MTFGLRAANHIAAQLKRDRAGVGSSAPASSVDDP